MADGVSIDQISISISADASAATNSINSLCKSLAKLENSAKSVSSLNKITSSLAGLKSVKGLDFSNLNFKISKSSVSNLETLVIALQKLPNATSLQALNQVGNGLNSIANSKTITKAKITSLQQLCSVLNSFTSFNMSSIIGQFSQMASAIAGMGTNMSSIGAATSKMASANRSLQQSLGQTSKATKTSTNYFGELKIAMEQLNPMSLIQKLSMLKVAILAVVNFLGTFINKANAYIENQNLFTAAMGSSTEAASEFGLTCQSLLGIDFNDWMRYQGVFQTLATGMGTTSQAADVMSQQLTQLGYDISSFYNISVDEAMLKLQSGLSGELEPLRRIGWDLSVARMNADLAAQGFEGTANSMTQAEKVALRYEMIMNQVTITHGDMARTLLAPANSIRVFQAQLQICARQIGNLLIPALSAIIPVALGVVNALTELAKSIASLFGIEINFEIDYSTLDTSGIATATDANEDLATSYDDAASSASNATKKIKEYKNTIMGFDELNVLNDETESGSDSSGTGGTGTSGDTGTGTGYTGSLPTYNFLDGLSANMKEIIADWTKKIQDFAKIAIPIITGIFGALKAYKWIKALKSIDDVAAKGLSSIGKYFRGLSGTPLLKTIAGIGIAVAGLTVMFMGAFDAWSNGLNSSNFIQMLIGMGVTIGGLALAFGTTGAAIGAIIGGLVIAIVSFKDALDNGLNGWNASGIIGGLTAVGTAIGALLLALTPVGWAAVAAGAAIGALAGVIAVGVVWGGAPCIEQVDELGDVSEETKERFGTSMDSVENVMGALNEHEFGKDVVSEEDVSYLEEQINNIKNTILENLDSNRNQELQDLNTLKFVMTNEEYQEKIDKINGFYDDQKSVTESRSSEMIELYKNMNSQDETQKAESMARIRELNEQQRQQLVQVSTATQEEINSINEKMAQNQEAIALESASKVIQNAKQEKEDAINTANSKYDELVAAANRAYEAGNITKEAYDAAVQTYENDKTVAINAANEKFDGIVKSTEDGLGESKDKINTENGQIKSNFELFWQDLGNGFNDVTSKIGDFFSSAYNVVIAVWSVISSWFDKNIKTPVVNVFNGIKGAIGDAFQNAYNTVIGIWNAITGWFSGIGKSIQDTFSNVCNAVGGFFTTARDTIVNIFNGIINTIKKPFNAIIDAINAIKIEIPDWVPGFGGQKWGFDIPRLASGGFIDTGQMFIAREKGPELVGKMGRQSAVANNQQIVSGIQQGVLEAMLTAAPVFKDSNSNKDGNVTLVLQVGNEELARAVSKGNASLARRGALSLYSVTA